MLTILATAQAAMSSSTAMVAAQPRYSVGCLVRVVGHHEETGAYAERGARVREYDALSQRYAVVIDGTSEARLRPLDPPP